MERTCENCRNRNFSCCYCEDNDKYEPISNADYIRSLSNEELAEFFKSITDKCVNIESNCQGCPFWSVLGCTGGGIEKWLQQPRKVEE